MRRLPRIPKGLKSRVAREERKANQNKKIIARRKEIEAMKKRLATLKAQNSKA